METKELTKAVKSTQKVQLVKGDFTPSEASHVVTSLIDSKINFHKIQRLQIWEGNHRCKTDQLDGRIEELEEEMRVAKEYINKARAKGQNIKINGILEIEIIN